MVMYKKLNGVTVEVSAEEEKEILADREKENIERGEYDVTQGTVS